MFLLVLSLFGFHGVISNDTTWSDTAYLTGDVLVENGVTLTIAPGTVVLYADNCKWDTAWSFNDKEHPRGIKWAIDLIVEGNLKAIGMINDSIYLSEFEGFYGPSNVIFVRGVDSLAYCNITVGQGELGALFGWGYPGMAFSNVEVSISRSLFNDGYGIWGENAIIDVNNTEFRNIYASMYCEYGCAGTGHLLKLEGGDLYLDSCSIFNTDILLGSVIMASNLDSCVVKNTVVRGAYGYGTGDAPPPTGADDACGCECINCQYVEIVNCTFDLIRGGNGDAGAGVGRDGGDAFGICLKDCVAGYVIDNYILHIFAGNGGSAHSIGGNGGDAIGIKIRNCSNFSIEGNSISNLSGGSGSSGGDWDGNDGTPRPLLCYNSSPEFTRNEFNSAGRYIYIDSTSQPVIGGASDKGNRFLNLTDKEDYVIYNNSPNDINAMYNFWQTGPDMIDSLIFDYYDDPTKGIVHYDHYTDVEEKKSPTQPFALRSNLVKDVLHVSLSRESTGGLVQLALFDASGRRVHSQSISGSQAAIDVSGLPRGIYFISARIGESKPVTPVTRVTRKVIIR